MTLGCGPFPSCSVTAAGPTGTPLCHLPSPTSASLLSPPRPTLSSGPEWASRLLSQPPASFPSDPPPLPQGPRCPLRVRVTQRARCWEPGGAGTVRVPSTFLSCSWCPLEPAQSSSARNWPRPASRASEAGRSHPGSPGTQPALLAAAPRACGSGRRWFRGGVTVMRFTGQGTPASCWRGLSCCSPGFCFRGISELTLRQPVLASPPVLS